MAGNLEVTDLPLIPAVDGADVYAAKNNLDYRVRTGEAGGLATLDGSGKLPTTQFPSSLTLTNITLTGTPQFFKADFSNANPALRAYFQSVGPNATTTVSAVPAGTGNAAVWRAFNSSDVTNSGYMSMFMGPTQAVFESSSTGAGVMRPMSFQFNGVEKVGIDTSGNTTGQGRFITAAGHFNSSIAAAILSANSGPINLRPNGADVTTNQATYSTDGKFMSVTSEVSGGLALLGNTSGLGANEQLINFAPNRWITYNTSSGRWQFGSAGSLQVADGGISTAGGSAGYTFADRSSARQWQIYGTGDVAWIYNGSSNIVAVDPSGNVTATNFTATSDRNLKEEIKDKPARRSLSDKLRLVEYIWKMDGSKGYGLIAQEVQELAPEYVHECDGVLSIDKTNLLLECVVELAARVRELEER